MSEQDVEIKPIFVAGPGGEGLIPAPDRKATLLERIYAWAWNLSRRPKVRAKQKEILTIAAKIRGDLKVQVLPHLWQLRLVCTACRENYGFLRNEVFVSTIRTMLLRMKCDDHPEPYVQFLANHIDLFDRSEELSAWINGFAK